MRRILFFVVLFLTGLHFTRSLFATDTTADPFMRITDFHDLATPGEHRATIHFGDFDRRFIFVTPEGFMPGDKLPLVFFFHGAGGTCEQAAKTYGWVEKANAEKFFMVFPEGLGARPTEPGSFLLNPHLWRDGRSTIPSRNVNDVEFFRTLLEQIENALPVDRRRVYVTGFSNGAGMTFTLGSHFSDRLAAIAPISSQSFIKIDHLARPLPVYYQVGTADPLVPYQGGTVTLPWGNTRTMPPVQESVDTWAALDGCAAQPIVVSDADGVRVLRYGPGQAGAEILYTIVEGNGHHWPGSVEPLPKVISGPALDPFSTTDRIWDFFKAHPLPSP